MYGTGIAGCGLFPGKINEFSIFRGTLKIGRVFIRDIHHFCFVKKILTKGNKDNSFRYIFSIFDTIN